jgi:hypothetical protein
MDDYVGVDISWTSHNLDLDFDPVPGSKSLSLKPCTIWGNFLDGSIH